MESNPMTSIKHKTEEREGFQKLQCIYMIENVLHFLSLGQALNISNISKRVLYAVKITYEKVKEFYKELKDNFTDYTDAFVKFKELNENSEFSAQGNEKEKNDSRLKKEAFFFHCTKLNMENNENKESFNWFNFGEDTLNPSELYKTFIIGQLKTINYFQTINCLNLRIHFEIEENFPDSFENISKLSLITDSLEKMKFFNRNISTEKLKEFTIIADFSEETLPIFTEFIKKRSNLNNVSILFSDFKNLNEDSLNTFIPNSFNEFKGSLSFEKIKYKKENADAFVEAIINLFDINKNISDIIADLFPYKEEKIEERNEDEDGGDFDENHSYKSNSDESEDDDSKIENAEPIFDDDSIEGYYNYKDLNGTDRHISKIEKLFYEKIIKGYVDTILNANNNIQPNENNPLHSTSNNADKKEEENLRTFQLFTPKFQYSFYNKIIDCVITDFYAVP
ncbi:MAG: hypothetical protein MJ252_15735, partial [archaeon]|nr:hypothetical protein [archaeon]